MAQQNTTNHFDDVKSVILNGNMSKDYIRMNGATYERIKDSLIEFYKELIKDILQEALNSKDIVMTKVMERDDDFIVLETIITTDTDSFILRFIPFFYFNNTKRLQVYTVKGIREILKDKIKELIQREQAVLEKLA